MGLWARPCTTLQRLSPNPHPGLTWKARYMEEVQSQNLYRPQEAGRAMSALKKRTCVRVWGGRGLSWGGLHVSISILQRHQHYRYLTASDP